MNKVYYKWLEFFMMNADFGPANWDVRNNIMDRFENETGYDYPDREDEDEGEEE